MTMTWKKGAMHFTVMDRNAARTLTSLTPPAAVPLVLLLFVMTGSDITNVAASTPLNGGAPNYGAGAAPFFRGNEVDLEQETVPSRRRERTNRETGQTIGEESNIRVSESSDDSVQFKGTRASRGDMG